MRIKETVKESLVKDLPEKKVEESCAACTKSVAQPAIKLLEAPKKIESRENYNDLIEQEFWQRMYY